MAFPKFEIISGLVFGGLYFQGFECLLFSQSQRCLAMPSGKVALAFARLSLLTYFIDISTVY
jgi:hypothetical protein